MQVYGQRKTDGPGAVLTLRPGQELKDLLFRMVPSGVIVIRQQISAWYMPNERPLQRKLHSPHRKTMNFAVAVAVLAAGKGSEIPVAARACGTVRWLLEHGQRIDCWRTRR
jgi:hypothetical protein